MIIKAACPLFGKFAASFLYSYLMALRKVQMSYSVEKETEESLWTRKAQTARIGHRSRKTYTVMIVINC